MWWWNILVEPLLTSIATSCTKFSFFWQTIRFGVDSLHIIWTTSHGKSIGSTTFVDYGPNVVVRRSTTQTLPFFVNNLEWGSFACLKEDLMHSWKRLFDSGIQSATSAAFFNCTFEATPTSNSPTSWRTCIGRLLSFWNGPILGMMFILMGVPTICFHLWYTYVLTWRIWDVWRFAI